MAVVGREQVGCASGSGGGGQYMIKWGKTTREMLGRLISAREEVR